MTTQITITPLPTPEPSLSPYQARMAKAPEIVNDDFLGSFADILDVINPLQHVPGISTVYRELTGDGLSSGANILGGAIFGGPLGLIAALANEIVEGISGKDIGANLFAAATGKYEKADKLSS